jgi:hypothetical protein
MSLPRSQIPVRPPCTWPAPLEEGDLLCAWRCCHPWGQQEDPDDTDFGIQSRGFDTRSIRFTHPLRVCCAMFASERLPAFLGWKCLPTGHRLHVSSSFRWFPHVLVAGARPHRPRPPAQLEKVQTEHARVSENLTLFRRVLLRILKISIIQSYRVPRHVHSSAGIEIGGMVPARFSPVTGFTLKQSVYFNL